MMGVLFLVGGEGGGYLSGLLLTHTPHAACPNLHLVFRGGASVGSSHIRGAFHNRESHRATTSLPPPSPLQDRLFAPLPTSSHHLADDVAQTGCVGGPLSEAGSLIPCGHNVDGVLSTRRAICTALQIPYNTVSDGRCRITGGV